MGNVVAAEVMGANLVVAAAVMVVAMAAGSKVVAAQVREAQV